MKVKDLKPAEYNPRKMSDKKLQMLKKSLREFGDLSGIIFNKRTGNLVSGHQRIKHLNPDWEITKKPVKDKLGTIAEGYIETSFGRLIYREVDWPKKRECIANIAANKHSGDFDDLKVKEILIELDYDDFDVELTGYDEKEIKTLMTPIFFENKNEIEYEYQIIVNCDNEEHQVKLLQQFKEEGLKCRPLIL